MNDRSEEATGDICIYCDQDTVPVGFWSISGDRWVGPFTDEPVCHECYKHYSSGKKLDCEDYSDSMTIHILRKRLEHG
tara:strand:+ start:184 stop:417 length:234 start_codon:yes stop_codon:yes gene_type:complete